MSLLKLYEEVDQYQVVLDWIDEHEDEIIAAGGELPGHLVELLDEVQGRVEEKVERTGLFVRNLEANAKAIEEEAQRLAKRARVLRSTAKGLKEYLGHQLDRLGVTRIDSPRCPVRWQTNGGKPSVELIDPNNVPEMFRRIKVEFDAEKAFAVAAEVSAALDSGEPITTRKGPFVVEFPELGIRVKRGRHVRVG